MKTFLVCALAGSAALLLAACGGGAAPPAATNPPAAAATSAPAAKAAATSAPAAKAAATSAPASSKQAAATSAPAPSAPAASGGSGSIGNEAVREVSMPANAVDYDPARRARVGETVKLPSGVVVQVHGAQTQEKDAANEWLIVDVTIGNGSTKEQTVSSIISFGAYSNACNRYGLSLDDIFALATASATGGLEMPFDETIEAGKAMRGNSITVVPKDAQGLALLYTTESALMGGLGEGPADPPVFVSLGVRGDFSPTAAASKEPGWACPANPPTPTP